MRRVLATALAVLSGALAGSLPSIGLIGSPSEPPGAWAHGLLGNVLMCPLTMAVALPLCLVVRWVLRRRRQRGPLAAMIAGGAMAAVAAVAFGWLPGLVFSDNPSSYWSDVLPLTLCVVGFALTWPLFLEWMMPLNKRLAAASEHPQGPGSAARRAWRTAIETLAAVAAVAPLLLLGFVVSFVVGLNTGEDWHPGLTFPSPTGRAQARVVERHWGGATGGIDTDVFVMPSARQWTERDRGLLVWSGSDIDSVRVVWDTERSLRVQARADSGRALEEHSQAWPRSGFRVRTEPLR